MGFCNSQLSSLGSDPNQKTLNMKTMLIVMLAICAMVVAEEETLQAEEQTLISYGAYPHAFRYGYGALPYAGLSYAAPSTYAVAAAPYNYNFLDTTKEPSAYLPRS